MCVNTEALFQSIAINLNVLRSLSLTPSHFTKENFQFMLSFSELTTSFLSTTFVISQTSSVSDASTLFHSMVDVKMHSVLLLH